MEESRQRGEDYQDWQAVGAGLQGLTSKYLEKEAGARGIDREGWYNVGWNQLRNNVGYMEQDVTNMLKHRTKNNKAENHTTTVA